ncbi:hydrolase [Clostridium sp. C8]|uniref:hydrolase n=1 Tax=Clostridium sp. C8 TaxID=1667357 RepID=UPI00062E6EBE|nr:hydrolase [Clostridium sp. C8]KLE17489.1 hydrolase [Clostridium sp. C8]
MITREEAWKLLTEYNKEEFHIQHALTVEGAMRYFAIKLGYEEESNFWANVGLLHDLDFEMYPEEHCSKTQEIMRERGIDERLIRAAASHGYGLCSKPQPKPEHQMEKVLFAVDELTGLIGAAARMRPSKSVMDMEISSIKKKFKDKKFAAGCSRDVIRQGAENLGWELDKLFEETILAMRSCEEDINNKMVVYKESK